MWSMAAEHSLAQGEIHRKTEMKEKGRRIQWVEKESSEAVEIIWTSTLKIMWFFMGDRYRKRWKESDTDKTKELQITKPSPLCASM